MTMTTTKAMSDWSNYCSIRPVSALPHEDPYRLYNIPFYPFSPSFFLPSPSFPFFLSLSFPPLPHSNLLQSPPLPIPQIPARRIGEALELPSGICDEAAAEMELYAF